MFVFFSSFSNRKRFPKRFYLYFDIFKRHDQVIFACALLNTRGAFSPLNWPEQNNSVRFPKMNYKMLINIVLLSQVKSQRRFSRHCERAIYRFRHQSEVKTNSIFKCNNADIIRILMILLFSGNKMVFYTQNKTVFRRRLTSNFAPKFASSKKMNDARNIPKSEMIFAQLNFSV